MTEDVAQTIERAESYARLRDRYVERNPAVMGGEPVITGTRVPVRTIASLIEMGETHEVLREDYPHVPDGGVPGRGAVGARQPASRPSRTPLGHRCEPSRAQASRRARAACARRACSRDDRDRTLYGPIAPAVRLRLVLLCFYAPVSSLTSRNRLRARIRLSC